MYDGSYLFKVVLKLALGESHVVKKVGMVVPCRQKRLQLFFLCARFRPALIGLYMLMVKTLDQFL